MYDVVADILKQLCITVNNSQLTTCVKIGAYIDNLSERALTFVVLSKLYKKNYILFYFWRIMKNAISKLNPFFSCENLYDNHINSIAVYNSRAYIIEA